MKDSESWNYLVWSLDLDNGDFSRQRIVLDEEEQALILAHVHGSKDLIHIYAGYPKIKYVINQTFDSAE